MKKTIPIAAFSVELQYSCRNVQPQCEVAKKLCISTEHCGIVTSLTTALMARNSVSE